MQSEQQSVLSDNHLSVTTVEKPTFYLPALLRSKHDDCDYTSVWATDLELMPLRNETDSNICWTTASISSVWWFHFTIQDTLKCKHLINK